QQKFDLFNKAIRRTLQKKRHCCWKMEEVSGFVVPEKRSPAITAGGAMQLIIVYL
ncbi:hypothetical protein HMPREF1604_02657, partial [Escherichia coli 908519]